MNQDKEAARTSMEIDLFLEDDADERVRQWVCRAYPETPGYMVDRVRRRVRQLRFRAMVLRASVVPIVMLLGLFVWSRTESFNDGSRHIARVEPSRAYVYFPLTNSDIVAIFSPPEAIATEIFQRQQVALLLSIEP